MDAMYLLYYFVYKEKNSLDRGAYKRSNHFFLAQGDDSESNRLQLKAAYKSRDLRQ